MGCTELIKARTSFVMFKLSRALSENEQKEEVGVKYWGFIERKIGEWRSFCIMVMEQMEYSSFYRICFVCVCVLCEYFGFSIGLQSEIQPRWRRRECREIVIW